jgi:hypothetical protein
MIKTRANLTGSPKALLAGKHPSLITFQTPSYCCSTMVHAVPSFHRHGVLHAPRAHTRIRLTRADLVSIYSEHQLVQ